MAESNVKSIHFHIATRVLLATFIGSVLSIASTIACGLFFHDQKLSENFGMRLCENGRIFDVQVNSGFGAKVYALHKAPAPEDYPDIPRDVLAEWHDVSRKIEWLPNWVSRPSVNEAMVMKETWGAGWPFVVAVGRIEYPFDLSGEGARTSTSILFPRKSNSKAFVPFQLAFPDAIYSFVFWIIVTLDVVLTFRRIHSAR